MGKQLLKGILATAIATGLLVGCGSDAPPPAEGTPAAPATTPAAPAETPPAGSEAAPADGTAPTDGTAPADGTAAADAEGEKTYELRKRLMDSTAQQEEWVPELTTTPLDSVAETLRRAQEAIAAGRYEQGENSALSLYLSVLETEPDNAEAKAGVDTIVAELVKRGEAAITQARFNEAARLAQVVVKVRPDDPAVQAFKVKVDAGREVGLLLGEAQRLAAEGKLVAPEGENAAAIYRDILRTDASNEAAKQGLAKLESDLIARATAAAEAGNYAESDRLLADAGRVQPGSKAVQNASTRIVELRQSRSGSLLQEANAAIEANQLDRASELLAQLEQVSAQAEGLDELRSRIENARNYSNLKPGQSVSDALKSGGKGPTLVVLPLGEFQMGSPDDEDDRKPSEGPVHTVVLRKAFAMARTEITIGQFGQFVAATGYKPASTQSGKGAIYDEVSRNMAERPGVDWDENHAGQKGDPSLPVVRVSWNDAHAYADWLSKETGMKYRLPSEAEWEYAARAGTRTRFPWGDGNPTRVVANLTGEEDRSVMGGKWGNSFPDYDDGHWGPAPVASFEANRFGLHDLAGNVSEWVEDCWHDNYQRAPADGSPWVNDGCGRRVLRGASWASAPEEARSAFRMNVGPGTTSPRLGFRVVREL